MRGYRSTGRLVLAAVLGLTAACGGSAPQKREDPTVALGRLREDLWRLDFRSVSAKALNRAVALAHRTRGPHAAVVWNQVATSRFDWALLALKSPRPVLWRGLLAHLGLAPRCLVAGELAMGCRAEVARAIADGFERAALIHGQEGDNKEASAARSRARLVYLAVLHQDLGSPEAAEALRKALNAQAYDIQRYAQLLFMRQWHQQKPALAALDGPLTGPQRLARAAPYPCPLAFSRLGRATPRAIEETLLQCNCHPGCAPGSPGGCTAVATPFAPLPPRLVTTRAALTIQSLRFLASLARRLKPRRYRGLGRKFRAALELFRTQVAALRVRVPYPPSLRLGRTTISPPTQPGLAPIKWEAHTSVHVVVSGDRVIVGLAPTLSAGESRPVLLHEAAGYPFPGKSLMISGSIYGLRRALGAAQTAASARLGPSRDDGAVALYIDKATPMVQVAAWVKRLQQAGARRTELLFGDGFSVGRSIRAKWDPDHTKEHRTSAGQLRSWSVRHPDPKQSTFGDWILFPFGVYRAIPDEIPEIVFTP